MMSEKIQELLNLVFELKAKGHDLFVELSPHVKLIKIRLHLTGWHKHENPDYTRDKYWGETNEDDNGGSDDFEDLDRWIGKQIAIMRSLADAKLQKQNNEELKSSIERLKKALEDVREVVATTSNQNAVIKMPEAYKIIDQALIIGVKNND